jgi:thiol-disulfide isomerase/thioredoxin
MKKFNEKNYEKIVSSNNKSVVFFTSKGCHLCKKLKPILESLEEQYGNSVDFYTTDVDEEGKLSEVFLSGDGVPTGFVVGSDNVYKIEDPDNPENDTWYSREYLENIIKNFY